MSDQKWMTRRHCLPAADEPEPVTVTNEVGRSPFVIVADHAGKYLPRRSTNAQLSGSRMRASHRLRYRRRGLLPDRRRAQCGGHPPKLFPPRHRLQPTPGSETSNVEASERTTVPGNIGLSKTQIEALIRENRRFNCGECWGTNQAPAIDWRQFSAPVYYWIKAPLNFCCVNSNSHQFAQFAIEGNVRLFSIDSEMSTRET
jgi:hypothetical protein